MIAKISVIIVINICFFHYELPSLFSKGLKERVATIRDKRELVKLL